jgi:Tfp pilus assembly protein PilX
MRLRRLAGSEEGFTMALVMIAMFLVTGVAAVALGAANRDLNLTRNDLDQKQAYDAAKAGIDDYAYHLNNDTNYWTKCTSVPTPHAVNQQSSTANRRFVPGSTTASYSIQLLPATGKTACSTSDPVGSMIEPSGPAMGTFRIRATGYSGDSKRSVVATFKRASFLDYVYFTQLETSDPVTYGDAATISGAYTQCTKRIAQGRYDAPIPGSGGDYCDVISFIDDEEIDGPLHTNDALVVCGRPHFGRSLADSIEVSSPVTFPPNPPSGWMSTPGCTGNPDFVGSYSINPPAPILTPPPTNNQLATVALPTAKYTGQVRIQLTGSTYSLTVGSSTVSGINLPANGVIYVGNAANVACSASYSPFTASYPLTSSCGNVYVRGTYSTPLTIAAQNDIIIDGNLIRSSGTSGMLGLIANNFVRVYHPYSSQEGRRDCSGGNNGSGFSGSSSPNRIDAAMLAIQHSFIVDHYDCGSSLGVLQVNGAISQKFRGAVGTFGFNSTGYTKDYNYDDRLRSVSPPYFLDPVQSAWRVQRETLDFP